MDKKKITKTVALDRTPECMEFIKKQRNFSLSIRRLIMLYCEEHDVIEDVEYVYQKEKDAVLKENEQLKKELARLRQSVSARQDLPVKAPIATRAEAPAAVQYKPVTPVVSSPGSDDDIPEGYL